MSALPVERESAPIEGSKWSLSVATQTGGDLRHMAMLPAALLGIERRAIEGTNWFARACTNAALREARGVPAS